MKYAVKVMDADNANKMFNYKPAEYRWIAVEAETDKQAYEKAEAAGWWVDFYSVEPLEKWEAEKEGRIERQVAFVQKWEGEAAAKAERTMLERVMKI